MVVLGVDVGGHSIRAGIVISKGKILAKEFVLTEPAKGTKSVIYKLAHLILSLLKKESKISKVGIGIPGVIDKNGFIMYAPNIPLTGINLKKQLSMIHKPLVFQNDANNFALAQHTFGSAKGYKNVIALTIGTGVGSGIILDGKLFSNNGAPELGHTTIKFDNRESKCCGNKGCIESFIGRKSFPEGPLEVYKKALVGHKPSLKRFEEFGRYLGIAMSNFINTFNPEIIVLGGQISNAYDFFKGPMQKELSKRALFKQKIVKNKMRDAGIIGAAVSTY